MAQMPSCFSRLWLTPALERRLFWLLMLLVLAAAALPRFTNLIHQGINGSDNFKYCYWGSEWARGNFTLVDFVSKGKVFYPGAFALHGLAMRLFGVADHSIRLAHAFMDMLNILLVFGITRRLTRDRWLGLAACIIYAFLPEVIAQSRYERVHIPSATFVLLSVLTFIIATEKDGWLIGLLPLSLSGLSLGAASLMHPDLGLLFPCFCLAILLHWATQEQKRASLGKSAAQAAAFALSFFALYLLSGLIMGFSEVYKLIHTRADCVKTIDLLPFELTKQFMTQALARNSSFPIMVLFLLTPASMIIALTARTEPARPCVNAYLPWILWGGYCLLFELLIKRNVLGPLIRLLIPLTPLAVIGLVYWHSQAIRALRVRRSYVNIILLICACLLALHAFISGRGLGALRHHLRGRQSPFRAVYERVYAGMEEDERLLVMPCIAYRHLRGFQQDLYFGNRAIYAFDFQGDGWSLDKIVDDYKVRWIFLFTIGLEFRLLTGRSDLLVHDLNDPKVAAQQDCVLGACHGWGPGEYDLERERELLERLVEVRGGELILRHSSGLLYELPKGAGL